jgi:hypothetical protein
MLENSIRYMQSLSLKASCLLRQVIILFVTANVKNTYQTVLLEDT